MYGVCGYQTNIGYPVERHWIAHKYRLYVTFSLYTFLIEIHSPVPQRYQHFTLITLHTIQIQNSIMAAHHKCAISSYNYFKIIQ